MSALVCYDPITPDRCTLVDYQEQPRRFSVRSWLRWCPLSRITTD